MARRPLSIVSTPSSREPIRRRKVQLVSWSVALAQLATELPGIGIAKVPQAAAAGGHHGSASGVPAALEQLSGGPRRKVPVVVIFDGAIDIRHPDFQGALWTHPGEKADGKDNDGNRIKDDIHGFSTVSNTGDVTDAGGLEHGTGVGARIVGQGRVDPSVRGVAAGKALLMIVADPVVRVGELTGFERAVDYAVTQKKKWGVNVRVMNASFGDHYPEGAYQDRFRRALQKLADADILAVLGAGNHGKSLQTHPFYPGAINLPNTITVAFLDGTGQRLHPRSGRYSHTVDIAAAGTNIRTSAPHGRVGVLTGNSIAIPAVSGALALILERRPSLTGAQARAFLLDNSDVFPWLTNDVAGGKVLNLPRLEAAMKAAGW